ncbi:MAG: AraC family transcriptional regulator [Pseudomonadota bacterium]
MTITKKQLVSTFNIYLMLCFGLFSFSIQASEPNSVSSKPASENVWNQLEDNKKSLIDLNRQLLNIEQELLFPASTQIKVFVSLNTGEFFTLDSVEIELDKKLVSSHLYTVRERNALIEGAAHDIFIGNVKSGNHRVIATIIGLDENKRNVKRAVAIDFTKESKPIIINLNIKDNQQSKNTDFLLEKIDPLL